MLWFLTLASIAAYIVGLILLVRITPRLLKQSFDDPFFLLTAAGAILGAMLAFGGIGILFVTFSELVSVFIRAIDAILLIILGVGIGLALLTSFIPTWFVARLKPAHVLRQAS